MEGAGPGDAAMLSRQAHIRTGRSRRAAPIAPLVKLASDQAAAGSGSTGGSGAAGAKRSLPSRKVAVQRQTRASPFSRLRETKKKSTPRSPTAHAAAGESMTHPPRSMSASQLQDPK